MRLVIKSRNCNGNAGLNRYKGEGIYQALGRKHTGLRKVKKDEKDAKDLNKNNEGEGIDVVDSNVDKCENRESDEESSIETISNFTEDESNMDDKEDDVNENDENGLDEVNLKRKGDSKVDKCENRESDEESSIETISNFTEDEPTNDDESNMDDKEDDVNENDENESDEVNLKRKFDEEAGVKQKYPPSIVDYFINNNADDSAIPIPTKLQCLQNGEMSDEKSKKHQLCLIHPTVRKKWPQKKCVICRRNYGLRKDTRYRCMQCDVPLCKEPCFAEYHYAICSSMPPKALT